LLYRRLGVVLTNADTVEEAVEAGKKVAENISIIYK